MKIITDKQIRNIGITPLEAYEWVKDVFLKKDQAILPPKISIKGPQYRFYNTMPCELPYLNAFGVKEVNRYIGRSPALDSKILLYNLKTGNCEALMDGNYITALRTGAVAALAVETLGLPAYQTVGIMGLGMMAHHTLRILLAHRQARGAGQLKLNLYRYKDHAETLAKELKDENVVCKIFNTTEEMIEQSEVVISCVSYAEDTFASDNAFMQGCLVVPVHTRGFQNCDLFFDKVFADDRGHVEGFQHFNEFKKFGELSNVLGGTIAGREDAKERIISYNIGIAAHDIYFAKKILERNPENIEIFTN